MKIALASDHAGFKIKQGIINYLLKQGIEHFDFGCGPDEEVDYVDYGKKAAGKVTSGEYDRAILVCGTGLGMAIVANKFRGIRATPCYEEFTAEMSRKHNDSNCLTLGGRILPLDEALQIVSIWLETEFEAGRHERRINKIKQIEENNFK
ncbi:MAG: ribose 5-phosphate isomerase B [Candidatus Aminicenantaceae bacterium]